MKSLPARTWSGVFKRPPTPGVIIKYTIIIPIVTFIHSIVPLYTILSCYILFVEEHTNPDFKTTTNG